MFLRAMFIYRVQQIAIRMKLFPRFVEERRDKRIETLFVIVCVFGQERFDRCFT